MFIHFQKCETQEICGKNIGVKWEDFLLGHGYIA
jgi:hypothetical protein